MLRLLQQILIYQIVFRIRPRTGQFFCFQWPWLVVEIWGLLLLCSVRLGCSDWKCLWENTAFQCLVPVLLKASLVPSEGHSCLLSFMLCFRSHFCTNIVGYKKEFLLFLGIWYTHVLRGLKENKIANHYSLDGTRALGKLFYLIILSEAFDFKPFSHKVEDSSTKGKASRLFKIVLSLRWWHLSLESNWFLVSCGLPGAAEDG